jgi:hypothetical protein
LTIPTTSNEVSSIAIVMAVVISLLIGMIILLLVAFFIYRRKFAKNEDKKQIPDQIKNETPLGQKVIGDSKIPVYQDIEGIQMGIPV